MPETTHTPRPKTPSAKALVEALARVRSRARLLLLVRRIGLLVALVLIAALLGGLLDAWLRFPSALRVAAWLGVIGFVVWAVWKFVLPAARFCPSLTDVALRVEHARPETEGLLASAMDLSGVAGSAGEGVGAGPTHDALAARVVTDALRAFKATDALAIINTTPAARAASASVLALLLVLVPALLAPSLWTIGAQRIFTPWTDATWPKRTGIADATRLHDERVHSLEEALPVRGLLTKWRRDPEAEDVAVRYRSFDSNGQSGRTQRALLTMQGDQEGGYLFERLIEPSGSAMEYRLETEDDATEWTRVRLVEPPAVASASVRITPPVYATGGAERTGEALDLGPGYDERAAAPASLAGSRVELDISFNRAGVLLAAGDDEEGQAPSLETLRSALGSSARVTSFQASDNAWSVEMILNDTTRFVLPLVDEYGIASVDTSVYRFDAVPDRAAASTITTPERDMTVLPGAVVDVEAEGRDDVGLSRVALERQTWKRNVESGPGGAMESQGGFQTVTEVSLEDGTVEEKATARAVRASLDLAELGLEPGDEVLLAALASDLFVDANGEARAPTRSSGRVLKIIGEDEFVREVREALAGVREGAIRLEQQQADLREATGERGAERTTTRAQAQVAQRLEQRLEELENIAERVDENRLDNQALSELLEEAQNATERAAQSASSAAQSLSQARAALDPQETDASLPEEEARAVADEQLRTEQELADLIEMLDRGEDNWVVRNQITQLLEQQREIQQQTGQLGQETAGLTPEELSEAQRRELEDIVREQEELAEDTEQLLEDLRAREQAMRESDPAGAEALRQAAQRAEQRQTTQSMQEAAEQAQQNQTSEAQQNQEEAAEALEEMLEDLDESERNRKEQLRRALFSLEQSIQALIDSQTDQIALLEAGGTPARELALNMVQLADNTSAVSAEARATGPELSGVANLLDRALDAQAGAIGKLRGEPASIDGAAALEGRSLELLAQALEATEALEEQLEQEEMEERKRELKRAYREALELQVTLRERTRPFAEMEELSRRDRVRLRQLGPSQVEVREKLEQIRDGAEEMAEARVYDYAHRRMARLSEQAEEAMSVASATGAVRRQDAIVDTLADLLESLEDPEQEDDPFQNDAGPQEGGGGGGGGQGQPEQLFEDLGQLRLLRELQIMIADDTAMVDGGGESLLGDLSALAAEQNELAGIAADLIEKITESPVPLDFLPENGGRSPLDDAEPADGLDGDGTEQGTES